MGDSLGYDVVLIGFGNSLRSDDGVGPAVIERLRRANLSRRVALVDAFQLTPELTDLAGRCQRLILIDASVEHPPGTIQVRRLSTSDHHSVGHRVEPGQFLHLARQLHGGPRRAVAYTIGVEILEFGELLSGPVTGAVARLSARLSKRFASSKPSDQPTSTND